MSTVIPESIEAVETPQHEQRYQQRYKNVGDLERIISVALGGAATLAALNSFSKRHPVRALLLMALGGDMIYRGASGYCNVYNMLNVTSHDATFTSNPLSREIVVKDSVTILKPVSEMYAFWRDFRNLPHVMSYLERVDVIDDIRSHWVAKGPGNVPVEWDAEIVEDEPGELISWRSMEGSEISNRGTVRFETATAGRGTVVSVQLAYHPPAGILGAAVAKIMGRAPEKEIHEDLRQLKHMMEAGESPTIQGQPKGYCR